MVALKESSAYTEGETALYLPRAVHDRICQHGDVKKPSSRAHTPICMRIADEMGQNYAQNTYEGEVPMHAETLQDAECRIRVILKEEVVNDGKSGRCKF